MSTIHVDVVSAEESIFEGEAEFVRFRANRASWASIRSTPR